MVCEYLSVAAQREPEAFHPCRPLYESYNRDPFGPANRDCRRRIRDVRPSASVTALSLDAGWPFVRISCHQNIDKHLFVQRVQRLA
jgi:hypothetical protein